MDIAPLKIGAGGSILRVEIECDLGYGKCSPGVGTVTMLARGDVLPTIYWYNPARTCGNNHHLGCWRPVVTPASLSPPPTYIYGNPSQIRDFAIAPSNTSHWYFENGSDGCIYTTTNKGVSWSKTGFTCGQFSFNSNQPTGGLSALIAVDPANENIVYASLPTQGSWVTTNGGTTWNAVRAIGYGGTFAGVGTGTGFVFDPSGGTQGSGATLTTKNIYACTWGTGVYVSGNAGSTWTLTSSGPSYCEEPRTDGHGVVWTSDGSDIWRGTGCVVTPATCWQKDPGGWAPTHNGAHIAIDPNACTSSTTCRIVIHEFYGNTTVSTTGGASWLGWKKNSSMVAQDIPWMDGNVTSTCYQLKSPQFDPTQNGVEIIASGCGVVYGVVPNDTRTSYHYTSISAEIEELVINWLITPPGALAAVIAAWDRPVFTQSIDNLNYPTGYGTAGVQGGIEHGWSVDYASLSPSFIVVAANTASGYATNYGGNGAATNWTRFKSFPDEVANGGMSLGTINASTSTNFMMFVSDNGDPYYTVDGGQHWTQNSPPGVPVSGTPRTTAATLAGSKVITFGNGLYSGLVASINAGHIPGVWDATNNCSPGVIASATATSIMLAAGATCGITKGDAIQIKYGANLGTGWGGNHMDTPHVSCADRVIPGVFYAYNFSTQQPGIYKYYNGGANVVRALSSALVGGQNGNIPGHETLDCVPGNAGNLYWTGGYPQGSGPGSHPNNANAFYECQDRAPSDPSANTVTCTAITSGATSPNNSSIHYGRTVTDVWGFGFGKAVGGTYPAVAFYGSIDGATMGYYVTYDHFQTFTQFAADHLVPVGASAGGYAGTYDSLPQIVSGDLNIAKRFYVCFLGSGCAVASGK